MVGAHHEGDQQQRGEGGARQRRSGGGSLFAHEEGFARRTHQRQRQRGGATRHRDPLQRPERLAMNDGARHHRHHRHHDRRQPGHVGGQQADDREPADIADGHRHQRDVADDGDRLPRRHEPLAVTQDQRADRDGHGGEQQLPAGEHRGRHVDMLVLEDQRADGPAQAGQQTEREAQRRLRVGLDAARHQHQHRRGTECDGEQHARTEPLAEHGPGDQRRPQRHREAEHRRLPRRNENRRIGAGDVPDHEVEEGRRSDGRPVPPFDDQRLPAQPGHEQQHDAGDGHRHGAKGPHRDLAHSQRKQRPVGAPDQREDDEQDEGAGRDGCLMRVHRSGG